MEEYDVRLTNHAEALLGRVNDLRKVDAFADVLIYCEDRMVRAHKVILASSSAYWDAVFRRLPLDVATSRYPLVVLPDTPVAVLELVLEFIYLGQVRSCRMNGHFFEFLAPYQSNLLFLNRNKNS
jgi:hypothetical protein